MDTPEYLKRIGENYNRAFSLWHKNDPYAERIGLTKKFTPFELRLVRALGELSMGRYIIEETSITVITQRLQELKVKTDRGNPVTEGSVRVNCSRIIKKIEPEFLTLIFDGVNPASHAVQIGLWYEYIIKDDLLIDEREIIADDQEEM